MGNKYPLFILLLVCQFTFGQKKNYNFINLNNKLGLSSNSVNAILKDKYGFMWFGTDDGLNKFDGQNFIVYRHRETDSASIGRGVVMSMQEDKNGNLWIGTNITLSQYNRRLNNFINFDFSKFGWIRSLEADHLGNIWVATYTGLYYFNPKTRGIIRYRANPVNNAKLNSDVILSVFEDSKNRVWIGTNAGLHLLNPQNGKFTRFLYDRNNKFSISNGIVRTLAEDIEGNIWIGTAGGLNKMIVQKQTFEHFESVKSDDQTLSDNSIYKISFGQENQLWVGTEDGLNIFDTTNGKTLRIDKSTSNNYGGIGSFVGHSIREIYMDNCGIYWIGTKQRGVNKYDSNLAFFNHKKLNYIDLEGVSAGSVFSFAEDLSGDIFIGTDDKGLNVFNKKTGRLKPIPLLGMEVKKGIILTLERSENTLWIGTYFYGIFVMNLSKKTVKNIPIPKSKTDITNIPVNCLKADNQGNVWVGTNGKGLYKYHIKTGELIHFSQIFQQKEGKNILFSGYINTIEADLQGNLWIGTNGGGLVMYNPHQNKQIVFNHDNSNLPLDMILAIHCDKLGQIWVGVFGGGLCLYDPKIQKFHQFSVKNFLANEVIYKILEDDSGKFWVSTNEGISVFDPHKKIFKNYTYHNGIQQSNFNIGAGLKTSTGEMFFGGNEGFNYFNSKALNQNKNIPLLVFTDLKIGHKSINPVENAEITQPICDLKKINLSYKQNFSLDFVALNYTAPQENQYTYMLEGFDKEWNQAGSLTTAIYTNLDPGEYKFRLKAQSEDNSWHTPEKVIEIIVHPPFWRTYYAYVGYLLILALTFWTLRRRAIQKISNQFALAQERLEVKHLIEKERMEAVRKMELEQLKIKFLTNLSHELKTPLTLILNPVENLLLKEKNSEKFNTLNLINRNAKRLLNMVNQLLDFRKIEENELKLKTSEGDLVLVAQELFDSFKYISDSKQIHLDFYSSLLSFHAIFDKDKVERILLNLLSNAIKFTNENGKVYFHIQPDAEYGIKLIVGDTGIGMPAEKLEKIFDRFYQVNDHDNMLNQGSGIGLSITQEIVKLHGGTISVESVEGRGSVFTVFIPLLEIKKINRNELHLPLGEGLNQPVAKERAIIESSKIEKPTVLLVDDSEDIRIYLKESLKDQYRIVEASDGMKGWQKALSAHPAIIVSDISMPNMDGITFVKKLKNDDRTRHIPVILLTVLGEEIDQLKGLQIGANDYLTKPFNFQLLNLKINNLLALNNVFKDTYTKQLRLEIPEVKFVSEDEKYLLKISNFIEDHSSNPDLSVRELSKKMNTSRGTMYSKILRLTGETPVEFLRSMKLKKALVLLENSDMKISHIAYEVGFSNPNYFTRAFKAKYNISPSEYLLSKKSLPGDVHHSKALR